jgi:hypothetical protein
MSARRPDSEPEMLELLRSSDVRAPQELHDRIDAMVTEHAARHPRPATTGTVPRHRIIAVAIGALAVLAVAIVLAGSGPSSLDVRGASALALAPATAPHEQSGDPAYLAVAVDGVAFPSWEGRLGWYSSGTRTDRVGGRTVRTVFYTNDAGQRIGYAIVAGTPAPAVTGGVFVWRGATAYRLLSEPGTRAVAWLRDGRLCVLAGRGVSSGTLLHLASSEDRATGA